MKGERDNRSEYHNQLDIYKRSHPIIRQDNRSTIWENQDYWMGNWIGKN